MFVCFFQQGTAFGIVLYSMYLEHLNHPHNVTINNILKCQEKTALKILNVEHFKKYDFCTTQDQ